MKLNKLNIYIVIFSLMLPGCLKEFVDKDDLNKNADFVKEEVMDMRDDSSITPEDYGSTDDSNVTLKPRNVLTIQGKERGLKFTDQSWEYYPISLNLNVVPIRTFFKVMANLTGLNIIVGDEVTGDISIELKDVDWYEVMVMVLKEEDLIHDVNESGNVITVHTHKWVEDHSSSFDTALNAKIKVINSLASLETKTTAIFKINYAQPETLAKQLEDVVKSLAAGSESGGEATASFVVDQRSNSLIVQASPADMIWIKETIDTLDKATKQVKVEVFIVEASDNFTAELGSRVGLFGSSNLGATGVKGQVSDLTGVNTATATGTLGGTPPTTLGAITTATTAGSVANNPIGNPAGALAMLFSGNTMDLRMAIFTVGIKLFKENPIFGHGTGDINDVLINGYKKEGFIKGYNRKYNCHNQFLQFLLAFGLIGLLIFLVVLFLPMAYAFSVKNYLYIFFILMLCFNFLFELILETKAGVEFYAYFNVLPIVVNFKKMN